jgi:hypothetical protein
MAKFASAFFVTLIGCTVIHGQDVRTNYLRGTDFSKYRTYSWVIIPGGGQPNQIIDSEIKQSIDSQLVAKGFTKVDSGTPDPPHAADFSQAPGLPQPPHLPRTTDSAYKADLLIGYQVAIDRERQWYATGMGDGFPGVACVLQRLLQAVQPLRSELLFSICTTLQPSSLYGQAQQRRRLTSAKIRTRTGKSWTRQWKNC